MALIKPLAPDQTRLALAAGAAKFAETGDALVTQLMHAPGQPIFTLSLQQLVDGGAGIGGATASGWRFVASADNQTAAAEVSQPVQGPPKLRSLSRGPQVEDALRALHEVETLPQAIAQDSELRVLRIPGLLTEALWLKPQAAGEDLVVPYLTAQRELQSKRVFSMSEFLDLIRPLAQAALEFDDSPRSLRGA